jgi:hypothetical protein
MNTLEKLKSILEILSAVQIQIKEERELHIMQLAAISTASIQNTRQSAKARIDQSSPYCTQAYLDVCRAVDREMQHRENLEAVNEEAAHKAMEKDFNT